MTAPPSRSVTPTDATVERRRPTKAELAAAAGKRVPDVIAPDLRVLFCGINPGLWSGAVGHHFARPGNRFWRALQRSGFTDTVVDPADERTLLAYEVGITNLVARATASAADLGDDELRAGAARLRRKVRRYRPRSAAFLGVAAFRVAFGRPGARIGRQDETIATTQVWVIANPSGLQAHYQLDDIADQMRELRAAVS